MRRVPKIPERYRQAPRCKICQNVVLLPIVNAYLDSAHSAAFIESALAELGRPVTRGLILKHKEHHQASAPDHAKGEDLAILVRDRTVKAVKDGTLEPTITHGLQAQALLDRRAEKVDDRDLRLQMARILSGAAASGYIGPPADLVIIEGEAEEVE